MPKVKTFNLYEKFSYMGYWRRPEDRKKKWAGKVSYDPETGIELELIAEEGEFASFRDPLEHEEAILGILPDPPFQLTVLGAWRLGLGIKYPEAPLDMVKYRFGAKYLLVGHWFRSPGSVCLNSVEVTFSSLRGWMWTKPIYLRDENQNSESSNDEQEVLSRETICLSSIGTKIELNDVVVEKGDYSERHEERKCYLRFESHTSKSLESYLKLIGETRRLFALLIGMPIQTKSTTFFTDESDPENSRVDVFFMERQPNTDVSDNLHMPFQYSMLGKLTTTAFQAWYGMEEKYKTPFDLCLDVIYNEQQRYSRFEFLALVQALESHHRLYYEKEGKKNKRYKHENGKVKRGPDLIDRLEELYENLPQFLLLDPDFNEDFLESVKDTRNYYSHYDSEDREKAMEDLDLFNAIARLVPFIAYFLYSRLGIRDDKINEGFYLAKHAGLWKRPKLQPLPPVPDDKQDENDFF